MARHGGLQLLLLLCAAAHISSHGDKLRSTESSPEGPQVVESTYRVETFATAFTSNNSRVDRYDIALLSTRFDRPMMVGGIGLENAGAQLEGAVRLRCGNKLFELKGLLPSDDGPGLVPSLVPVSEAGKHPVLKFLAHTVAGDTLKSAAAGSSFHALLMLSVDHDGMYRTQLPSNELAKCTLRFINAARQSRRSPTVVTDERGRTFAGAFNISRERCAADGGNRTRVDASRLNDLRNGVLKGSLSAQSLAARAARTQEGTCNNSVDHSFMEPGSSALQLDMDSIVDLDLSMNQGPVAMPFYAEMMGKASDFVKVAVKSAKAQNEFAPGWIYEMPKDIVEQVVVTGVSNKVAELDPAALAEQLAATVTAMYVSVLAREAVPRIIEKVSEPVTTTLASTLRYTIPASVDKHAPRRMMHRMYKPFVGHLSKALTHSITSSLMHSMTHSPQTDYYCYYCHKHKMYCEYCHVQPTQLYYAQYYAGFYSAYYTDYYIREYAQYEKKEEVKQDIFKGSLRERWYDEGEEDSDYASNPAGFGQ